MSSPSISPKSWNPEALPTPRCAVLLLNCLVEDGERFAGLWEPAKLRIAVDGGANHVHGRREALSRPHWVTGDFDSIEQSILKAYEEDPDVKVFKTPDQDHTDFTKALMKLAKEKEGKDVDSVVAFVESGGRMDQVFANVETLFLDGKIFRETSPAPPVYLASSRGVGWLLRQGRHEIIVPKDAGHRVYYVGLVPVGEKVEKVTTTGLKWNLDKSQLGFGLLVSTSNAFEKNAEKVTVDTSGTLLFTLESDKV